VVPDTEVTETGKDEGEISNTPVPTRLPIGYEKNPEWELVPEI
jgi:hypothetical protein